MRVHRRQRCISSVTFYRREDHPEEPILPGGDGGGAEKPNPFGEFSVVEERSGEVVCLACRRFLAFESDGISVSGSHRHECVNPAGIAFVIELYAPAEGCLDLGTFTTEYSWFSSYSWRYAVCLGCGSHLGWKYHLEESANGLPESFFGLISDKILHLSRRTEW